MQPISVVHVDVRWRPSGGRGEYEFVPSDVLLGKRVIIDALSVPSAFVETDVSGYLRDGKPRLRRKHPNDRHHLNVPPLVAALAWLPAPRREDNRPLKLPLQEKEYVASSITFNVAVNGDIAFASPLAMRVLHYEYEIDLRARLHKIRQVLPLLVKTPVAAFASEYVSLIQAHSASSRLSELSRELRSWLNLQDSADLNVDVPDDEPAAVVPIVEQKRILVTDISAEETKRRLVAHFRIDRSTKLREARIAQHLHETGSINCENCTFNFGERYPNLGEGFIEVHHKKPLALLMPNEKTYLSDLMLLCANCHRMIHRKRPPLTPETLKAHTSFSAPKS